MERIKRNPYERGRPVRLYLDDIEFLIEKMGGADGRKVEITHGDVRYESLAELSDNIKRDIHSLNLHVSGPDYFHLYVDIHTQRILIHGDSQLEDRCAVVTAFLREKATWSSHGAIKLTIAILVGLAVTASGMRLGGLVFAPSSAWIMVFPLGLLLGFALPSIFPGLGRSRITLYHKLSRPSFWERNRDEFVIRVYIAIVTGVITGTIGFLVGSHHSN